MKQIQIQYLNDSYEVLGTYNTGDENTREQREEWNEWLNDGNLEHPDAPEDWTQFRLVAVEGDYYGR